MVADSFSIVGGSGADRVLGVRIRLQVVLAGPARAGDNGRLQPA